MPPEPTVLEVHGDPTHCFGTWTDAPLALLRPEAFTDSRVALYPRCRIRPVEAIDTGWALFHACKAHGEEVRKTCPIVMVTPLILD